MAETVHNDLDVWISKLEKGKLLSESEVVSLTDMAQKLFMEESSVQPVPVPVTIVGDIHGQWHDLIELFCIGGSVPETNYLFVSP